MTQIITSNSGGGGGAGAYTYKGTVNTYEDLPSTGLKIGDVYNVINEHTTDPKFPAGANVAWTGTEWDVLGGTIDLSIYQKKLVEGTGIDIDGDTNEISVDASIVSGASAGATAVQPGDDVSDLNNDAGYITSSDIPTDVSAFNNDAGYIDKDVNDLTNYTKTSDLPDFTTYQLKSNMVTSLNSADDNHYPTAKAVKDAISSAGGGDVSGPSSSVDGHLAVFDGATGKIIKDGGAIPTPTTVVDDLSTQSATSALSANQGYVLKGYVDAINGKIPSEASSSNKLADKNYVDDSINQVAAYYITKNASGAAFATKAELLATTTFYSGGVVRVPTRNDYCIVLADETHNGETTRYSYQGSSWEYQYTVNETALTQAQLDALNSGITSGKVSTYDGYASTISGKQDALTLPATPTQGNLVAWGANNKTLVDGGAIPSTADCVKTSGDQTIAGTKTFSTSPVVPNKTSDAANTGTAIATEAQVYKKQDKLTTQTAYTSKGTSTKVPTITTNTLGQVTGITETSIAFPVTSVGGSTGAVGLKTINGNSIVGSGNITVSSSTTTTCTLTSAGWSSNSQTVSVSGVTASNTVIVSPAPDYIQDYADCGVYGYGQGSGTITFKCDTAPSGDIVVNVLIMS